ncbi:alkylhydroperoxidase family enzyme [Devosia sp. UYZn731]|uniref:carboxymuconolactone decarboxylase family protein n=1 Tax=Devosia sp. UYZn731 TaxID=3156345 RepID=UPI003390B430
MSTYLVLTRETAPDDASPVLAQLQQAFGFLPNVAGVMAASPALIKSFWSLFSGVHAGTFTDAELQVLLLTNAVTNGAEWAVAFHSGLALHFGIDGADVKAIRGARLPGQSRLAALSTLSRRLIEQRGKLTPAEQVEFVAAGFRPEQLLEATSVVAASTITNYVSSIAQPPVEAAFADHVWQSAASNSPE